MLRNGETHAIAFYISRLDQLLMTYADTIMPNHYPDYNDQIEAILTNHVERNNRKNKNSPPMDRARAVSEYLKNHINKTITAGNVESLQDSLPKEQAFVLVNGGELYKVRILLPSINKSSIKSFINIINLVNCVSY